MSSQTLGQDSAIRAIESEAHLWGADFSELSGSEQEQLERLLTDGHSRLHDLHEQVYDAASHAAGKVKEARERVDRLELQPHGLRLVIAKRRLHYAEGTLALREADIKSVEERYSTRSE